MEGECGLRAGGDKVSFQDDENVPNLGYRDGCRFCKYARKHVIVRLKGGISKFTTLIKLFFSLNTILA